MMPFSDKITSAITLFLFTLKKIYNNTYIILWFSAASGSHVSDVEPSEDISSLQRAEALRSLYLGVYCIICHSFV